MLAYVVMIKTPYLPHCQRMSEAKDAVGIL